jgi:peptidyl-tRNA hydrolase
MSEYILYILMRNDLPSLNAGKAMAQASHASNAFIKSFGNAKSVKPWINETPQGFGTVIVLSANEKQVNEIIQNSENANVLSELIVDPTYPYIVNNEVAALIDAKHHTVAPIVKTDGTVVLHRKEITCAYVYGSKEDCKKILGHLPLHP